MLELTHEVGEEVFQSIAVLVELQEALFMLGGGRNGFQSAFLVRTCDDFEILVFLILDQRTSWSLIFRPYYNVFNGTNSGARTKVNQRNRVRYRL